MYKIGVDIGGSHITAALIETANGRIHEPSLTRAKLDPHAPAQAILEIWANSIQNARLSLPTQMTNDQYLGLAMPGPFDYPNGISLMTKQVNKYENLYGLNIRNELAERLDLQPQNIKFRNDAEAFLEGEMHYGAGKKFKIGFGLTLGTGFGTSLYKNGKGTDLALGINYSLNTGVAEDYISTRWFVSRYQELTQKPILGVKQLVEVHSTDPIAQQIFIEFAQNLGQFMEEMIALHDPEVFILGGNIAQGSALFFPAIKKRLTKPIPLVKSELNERAALIGSIV